MNNTNNPKLGTNHFFEHQLIKGKITETIFDQMFREGNDFIVIPFGYESILPEITQYAEGRSAELLKDNIRHAPDFALISPNHNGIYLVEVKYRAILDMEDICDIAEKIHKRWKLVWLFVATQDGFYFDSCANILHKKEVTPLATSWIPQELQNEYLDILKHFVKNRTKIKT